MSELVLLVGLQGSGKSTFYASRFAETHTLVSKDLLGKRHLDERVQLRIAEALDAGQPVVVDNCNVSRQERELLIRTAGSAPVHAYVFPFEVESCLRRNAQRQGKKRVPNVAIYAFRKRYVEPTWDEGYARMFDVRISEADFHVTPRPSTTAIGSPASFGQGVLHRG